jgi:hypothetical protein
MSGARDLYDPVDRSKTSGAPDPVDRSKRSGVTGLFGPVDRSKTSAPDLHDLADRSKTSGAPSLFGPVDLSKTPAPDLYDLADRSDLFNPTDLSDLFNPTDLYDPVDRSKTSGAPGLFDPVDLSNPPDLSDLPPAFHDLLGAILSRIDRRLVHEKLSARAACLKAGLSAGQIKTMRRQHRMKLQHGISNRTLTSLAEALNTTPEWLSSGVGPEERAPNGVAGIGGEGLALPLAGVVAAGVWTEVADKIAPQQSSVPADPRYPASWQRAYEVRGNSVDRIARSGDFLIVVDRTSAGLTIRPGDILIVTRTKDGLQEVSARRFQKSGKDCLLMLDSTDTRHNSVTLPLRSLVLGSDQQETYNNAIGGIVIGVYRPLMIS